MKKIKSVIFKKIGGHTVPVNPWPQTFFISKILINEDIVEIRSITITSLLKVIIRNFITMNWHRFKRILFVTGFIDSLPGYALSFSYWRWDFWNVLKERNDDAIVDLKMEKQWKIDQEKISKMVQSFNIKR